MFRIAHLDLIGALLARQGELEDGTTVLQELLQVVLIHQLRDVAARRERRDSGVSVKVDKWSTCVRTTDLSQRVELTFVATQP